MTTGFTDTSPEAVPETGDGAADGRCALAEQAGLRVLSGIMWAIANTCWFIANESLSFAVAFPLITSGPGIVAAMWGIFMFGEIRGRRNLSLFAVAVALNVLGSVLIAISK